MTQEEMLTSDAGSQYNIVDGWAGAANPHLSLRPHPTPLLIQTLSNVSKMLVFPLFDSCSQMDQRTDGQRLL